MITPAQQVILGGLCPPCEESLVTLLLQEFASQERRFVLGDWEATSLDGGQFAEIMARIMYHLDSGNLNLSKSLDDCLKYIDNDQATHIITPRHDAIHISKVLRVIYKFRSQRGAVHISPNYSANYVDSKLIMEMVRWTLNEYLRISWQGNKKNLESVVRSIADFEVPAVAEYEGELYILRTDISVEEEILILLYQAGEAGLSRTALGKWVRRGSPSTITRTLQAICSSNRREVRITSNGAYALTHLGIKHVVERLADKLTLSHA